MTIADDLKSNLTAINTERINIKNALNSKFGVGLTDNSNLTEYATKINALVLAPYVDTAPPAGFFSKVVPSAYSADNTMYYNGDFKASRVMNAVYNDYAEFFEAEDEWNYGDVIEINPSTNKYRRSTSKNSTLVVGVASNSFGSIVGGEDGSIEDNLLKYIPIGLMGRVFVKVDMEVNAGDLLTSSELEGCATKSQDIKIGTIIGKALSTSKDGYVEMLIMRM